MRPVIEKRKFGIRHVFYILILIICIVSIGVAIYMQFYRDAKLDVILGISKEDTNEEELNNLRANFLNNFDNTINIVEPYSGEIKKIRQDDDIILQGYEKQENTTSYSLNVKIPYFNIDSDVAQEFNTEIRDSFRDKAENIITMMKNEKNLIVYNVRYKAYVWNDILSLVIISELKEGENSQKIILKTYNYNIKEDKASTTEDLFKTKRLSKNNIADEIKKEVNKSQEQSLRLKEAGYDVKVRDVNSSFYQVENIKEYFIGENGYLYIVYPYGNNEYTSQMDIIIFR